MLDLRLPGAASFREPLLNTPGPLSRILQVVPSRKRFAMIRVGIVGLGFMGRMHYRCWKAIPNAKITAICEANSSVLAALGEPSKGNVEGAADHIDLKDVSVHSDLGELLASRSVDALSITLPTFLHPDTTVKPRRDRRARALRETDGDSTWRTVIA